METTKVKNHELYFGRTVRFVDNNGNLYPEAFVVVDSQTDIINKMIKMRAIYYRSIESFELGETPISHIDGGIVEVIFRAENWDRFMVANSTLSAQTAMAIHGVFDSVADVPKGDGTFQSRFAEASEVILPK